jgi:hypothetical protein
MGQKIAIELETFLEVLWLGFRDNYTPNETQLEKIPKWNEQLKAIKHLDPNEELCVIEEDKDGDIWVWRKNAWLNKQRSKENLSKEVKEGIRQLNIQKARIALIAATIRRALGSSYNDTYANLLALQISKHKEIKDGIAILTTLGVKDVSCLTDEIEDPDEYI